MLLNTSLSKSFASTSHTGSLEKASQRERMPLGGGSLAPPCGCSCSSLEMTQGSQREHQGWGMLQIKTLPTSSRTPLPPLPSHPINTVPSEERSPLWRLAQVPPETMAAYQPLKSPPRAFSHCSTEALNTTKYQNTILQHLCSTLISE